MSSGVPPITTVLQFCLNGTLRRILAAALAGFLLSRAGWLLER
eukprot:CAMPEP_0171139090 /NCGR_PEP_ID=MMETSP0766_2-20121228/136283_1 /TAXON_ID=439317 /ORGANISM="Gambierdiscus australes, Strain CAWD 149" /LENGTH=42 /DNA_ID= /DNA_START= /DNA_END= /DNA_ORIENTATION=